MHAFTSCALLVMCPRSRAARCRGWPGKDEALLLNVSSARATSASGAPPLDKARPQARRDASVALAHVQQARCAVPPAPHNLQPLTCNL